MSSETKEETGSLDTGSHTESNELPKSEPPNSQSVDSYHEIQTSLGLQPRAIVLAKVKGYRPWPAMVLEESILPENIKKIKPKTVRLEKKLLKPVINVPVRFFSDDTYIWIKSCDLKLLDEGEIDAFLAKKSKLKKHDLLTDAYILAKDPPDMHEFNIWGSAGPQDLLDSSGSNEPEKKKLKLSIKLKNGSKKSATSKGPQTSKTTKKPTSKSSKTTQPGVKPKVNYNYDNDDEDDFSLSPFSDGYDSDWGLDEPVYDFENGNYIFDDEKEQEDFVNNFPAASDLALELSEYSEEIEKIHEKISPLLVEETIDDDRVVLSQLKKLEKYLTSSQMPLVALTKSPLFRVLVLTLHRPKELYPYESIKRAVKKILLILSLDPCQLTAEDTEGNAESGTKDDHDEHISPEIPDQDSLDGTKNGEENGVAEPFAHAEEHAEQALET